MGAAMRPHYIRQSPSWKEIAATVIILGGVGVLLLWNVWDIGYQKGLQAGIGANQCAPIVIYRRGVDNYTPTELRRLANARERAV